MAQRYTVKVYKMISDTREQLIAAVFFKTREEAERYFQEQDAVPGQRAEFRNW